MMTKYTLNELCDFITDGTHQTPEYCENGGYIFLSSKDVTSRKIDWNHTKRIPEMLHEKLYERLSPQKNDILLAKNGTTGVAAIVDKDEVFDVYVSLALLRPKKNVYPLFLYYAINSPVVRRQFDAGLKGIGVPNLHLNVIRQAKIQTPTYTKQIDICKTLNKIERIIENLKEELVLFDNLVKARFVEMFDSISNNKFGYEVMTLQDVCEPIRDGTHQTPTYTEDTVNGYKFLSSKDVTSGNVDWNHLKYIPEELHNELYKRISPRKGDILLAKNGTTGVAAIVDRDDVFDIYVSLALLRPLGMVTSEYLCSAVNCIETKRQFDSSLKGIGVPNLHLGEIKKTKIVVPPIEAQEQFAGFVKQIDKSKFAVKKALEKAQLLFDSLMQKYFG